jgi:hypothetical protein
MHRVGLLVLLLSVSLWAKNPDSFKFISWPNGCANIIFNMDADGNLTLDYFALLSDKPYRFYLYGTWEFSGTLVRFTITRCTLKNVACPNVFDSDYFTSLNNNTFEFDPYKEIYITKVLCDWPTRIPKQLQLSTALP